MDENTKCPVFSSVDSYTIYVLFIQILELNIYRYNKVLFFQHGIRGTRESLKVENQFQWKETEKLAM